MNTFATLYQTNVNEYVERKGEFTYLSWPYAVAQLRLADPTASWEVKRFDGKPFCRTEAGYFVEVAVTVQELTLSQIHPVLDGRNRPLMEPTAFDINTSIQRCLVKAIALHGLGLYIYAGEDLPNPEQDVPKASRTAVAISFAKTLSHEQIAKIEALMVDVQANSRRMLEYFKVDQLADIPVAAYDRVIKSLEKSRRSAA